MKIQKIVEVPKKRLGRGHGSGKVKTSGRGTKGQKARGTMPWGFEGGQLSIIKRLPLLRGKTRNKSIQTKPTVVTLSDLNTLKDGTQVTLEVLKKEGVVQKDVVGVKVLADGRLAKKLTVTVPCSKTATAAIQKAGGTVVSA
jgi:large subunit ribosomal protein L15